MSLNGTKVIFLENEDFSNNGVLTYKGKPLANKTLIMVQGNFCGYCTKSKPGFSNLANKHGSDIIGKGTVFATIQIDGSESEKKLKARLPVIAEGASLNGVPAYLLFENGKFVAMYEGARDEASLKKFLSL